MSICYLVLTLVTIMWKYDNFENGVIIITTWRTTCPDLTSKNGVIGQTRIRRIPSNAHHVVPLARIGNNHEKLTIDEGWESKYWNDWNRQECPWISYPCLRILIEIIWLSLRLHESLLPWIVAKQNRLKQVHWLLNNFKSVITWKEGFIWNNSQLYKI